MIGDVGPTQDTVVTLLHKAGIDRVASAYEPTVSTHIKLLCSWSFLARLMNKP